MKATIAIGFALSVLAAGSALAAPEHNSQRVGVTPFSTAALDNTPVNKPAVKPFDNTASAAVIVAENRKEFGSAYQRY